MSLASMIRRARELAAQRQAEQTAGREAERVAAEAAAQAFLLPVSKTAPPAAPHYEMQNGVPVRVASTAAPPAIAPLPGWVVPAVIAGGVLLLGLSKK